jgi:hypothetical protein
MMPHGYNLSAARPILSQGHARRIPPPAIAGYPHIHMYPQKKKNQKENRYYDYGLLRT